MAIRKDYEPIKPYTPFSYRERPKITPAMSLEASKRYKDSLRDDDYEPKNWKQALAGLAADWLTMKSEQEDVYNEELGTIGRGRRAIETYMEELSRKNPDALTISDQDMALFLQEGSPGVAVEMRPDTLLEEAVARRDAEVEPARPELKNLNEDREAWENAFQDDEERQMLVEELQQGLTKEVPNDVLQRAVSGQPMSSDDEVRMLQADRDFRENAIYADGRERPELRAIAPIDAQELATQTERSLFDPTTSEGRQRLTDKRFKKLMAEDQNYAYKQLVKAIKAGDTEVIDELIKSGSAAQIRQEDREQAQDLGQFIALDESQMEAILESGQFSEDAQQYIGKNVYIDPRTGTHNLNLNDFQAYEYLVNGKKVGLDIIEMRLNKPKNLTVQNAESWLKGNPMTQNGNPLTAQEFVDNGEWQPSDARAMGWMDQVMARALFSL